jgi:hypothetical protein
MADARLSLAVIHTCKGWVPQQGRIVRELGATYTIDQAVEIWGVMSDREYNGWPGNIKNAWIMGASSARATHHIIIWDHVLLCTNFFQTVKYLVQLLPENAINLGNWSPAANQARVSGKHWFKGHRAYPGALIIPRGWLTEFMTWVSFYDHERDANPDPLFRLTLFLVHKGYWVYSPAPSLVQYLHHTDSLWRRLLNGEYQQRVPYFVGTSGHPLAVDWTLGLDTPALEPTPGVFYRALRKLKHTPRTYPGQWD